MDVVVSQHDLKSLTQDEYYALRETLDRWEPPRTKEELQRLLLELTRQCAIPNFPRTMDNPVYAVSYILREIKSVAE